MQIGRAWNHADDADGIVHGCNRAGDVRAVAVSILEPVSGTRVIRAVSRGQVLVPLLVAGIDDADLLRRGSLVSDLVRLNLADAVRLFLATGMGVQKALRVVFHIGDIRIAP